MRFQDVSNRTVGERSSDATSILQGLAPTRPASARAPTDVDLQSLLGDAVGRLASETGCRRVAAWGVREDASPYVIGATPDVAFARSPDAETYRALASLDEVADLGSSALAERFGLLFRGLGFSAAAPLRGVDHEPLAVLLLGDAQDPPGRVRPRTMAALAAAARRLATPAHAAAAMERLARVDAGVRRLSALAALGDLVSEIVHEVRNPLVSVKTFLQLLPDRMHDPEFQTQFFDVVSEEMRRIERLLDVVLQHARPDSKSPEEGSCSPQPVFESVARLLTHRALERGVRIEVEASDATLRIPMSEDRLRQIVLNLAMNALEVAPPESRVRLMAELRDSGVRVAVEDQGPGIPDAVRKRVFEPFFSTKSERPGGLGLAISKRLAEEAEGRIAIEDTPDGGTRFVIDF